MAERGEAAAAEESSAKIPQSPEELPSGASDDALEDTCGFCRFMKSGPCGQIFKKWEDCVDEYRDDEEGFVDKCFQETQALKECMDRNPEYYHAMMEDESIEADETHENTEIRDGDAQEAGDHGKNTGHQKSDAKGEA